MKGWNTVGDGKLGISDHALNQIVTVTMDTTPLIVL